MNLDEEPALEVSTDELIAAELLWSGINVGDSIELEADIVREGEVLLSAGRAYQVVAKHGRDNGAQFDAFYVQTEERGELVAVSPAFIANYTLTDSPQSLS